MAENSKIEWTHHTWNPWRGCEKVSAGCDHCYAEAMSKRNPAVLGEWGPDGHRAIAAEDYWKLPYRWNRKAQETDERQRVFCLSLGDVWEDRPELIEPRGRLLATIAETPHLDWLLLTKRPEGIEDRLQEVVRGTHDGGDELASHWLDRDAPANVWLGVSIENQETANERLPHLLRIPAVIRFISAEPLLGPVSIEPFLWLVGGSTAGPWIDSLGRRRRFPGEGSAGGQIISHRPAGDIHWVIVGGESGPGARPMHPDWARTLRDECQAAGVAYFFKQWGQWGPMDAYQPGNDTKHWANGEELALVGKHRAGRILDGRTWDEFPEVAR